MTSSAVSIRGVVPQASAGDSATPAAKPAFLSDIGDYVKLVTGLGESGGERQMRAGGRGGDERRGEREGGRVPAGRRPGGWG